MVQLRVVSMVLAVPSVENKWDSVNRVETYSKE